MTESRRILGRTATAIGWFCVVGLTLLIFDMVQNLRFMPEEWWRAPGEVQLPPGQFDIRMKIICPGPIGWSGAWGYVASFIWLPYSGWRAFRAVRSGMHLAARERVVLTLVPIQIASVQFLLRATPLKYGYPLF